MSQVKQTIINELARLLNTTTAEIDPDMEFFNLGLDSLDAMHIFSAVQKITAHTLSPTLLFEYDTVNKISAYVAALDAR